jgi:hypothetical protein
MTRDGELENWRRQWQSGSQPALDAAAAEELRARVLRETSGIKMGLMAPILVTLVTGGTVLSRALHTRQSLDVLLAIETWIFIVVVWVGSLWIARGTWRPLGNTTTAFVDVSIRRREAYLRGATFGVCLYVAQLVFMVLAIAEASPVGMVGILTSRAVILFGWVALPSIGVALYWFRRRQRADLERLRKLERQLEGD